MPAQTSVTTGVFQLMINLLKFISSVAIPGHVVRVAPFPQRVTCFKRSLTAARPLPVLSVSRSDSSGGATEAGGVYGRDADAINVSEDKSERIS
jgi:hypothetical protein